MTKTWFTSDWHLGHQRIIELSSRPFRDLDEMHAQLIERHNALVAPDDEVWVLGDVCMGPIDESLALVARFNGVKRLVAGNHDRCFHGYGDNRVNPTQLAGWIARYRRAGFASVLNGYHVRRVGFGALLSLGPTRHMTVELCHFPTRGESAERPDRYVDYRPRPVAGRDYRPVNRRWVVCGHVHEAWRTRGRNLNVGVDAWNFQPVAEADVVATITQLEAEHGAALDDTSVTTPVPSPTPPSHA